MKTLLVSACLIMTGCTLFGEPIAEKVADGVSKYCTEPYSQRLVYYEYINRELETKGHHIAVVCAGDPE